MNEPFERNVGRQSRLRLGRRNLPFLRIHGRFAHDRSPMLAPRVRRALSKPPAIELTLAVSRAVEASALPVLCGDFQRSQHGADSGKAHRGLRDSDAQGLFERLAYAR